MSEVKKTSTKSVAAASEETKTASLPLVGHVKAGAADMAMQHLHGLSMGLTSFLADHEKAAAEGKDERFQTLRHLTEAHRKYREHTHDAHHTFIHHVLNYKSSEKSDK
jgi:hypothetical protein